MLLNQLTKAREDVFLIEGSLEGIEMNLKSLGYLDKLRGLPAGAVEASLDIRDRRNEPLAMAYKNRHPEGDFWLVIPYPHTLPMRKQTESMVREVSASGAIASQKSKKVDARAFEQAVRQYLSASLAEGSLCDCTREKEPASFVKNDQRSQDILRLVKKLSRRLGKNPADIDALEICCGNGMSTVPLRQAFRSVLSIDNDRCAVCNGLTYGVLVPEDTAVLDAAGLSRYGLGKYGAVVGFMLGTIYEFNKPLWRKIFTGALDVLNDDGLLLFTVNNEEEMDFLAESFASMGVSGDVIDNHQKDSIYDHWAFIAKF